MRARTESAEFNPDGGVDLPRSAVELAIADGAQAPLGVARPVASEFRGLARAWSRSTQDGASFVLALARIRALPPSVTSAR